MSILHILAFAQAYIEGTGTTGTVALATGATWQTDRRTVQHAMLTRLINWFRGETEPEAPPATQVRRRTAAHSAVHFEKREPNSPVKDYPDREPPLDGQIEDQGPGKNVLVGKTYIREDTGSYETLKIVDDSVEAEPEIDGIDPYNSGQFDRSRHWDRRFRD